jgi:hypothetical protein
MIGVWHLILAFALGALVAESSGVLVGFIVYRTKREPHETLFSGPGQGGAYLSRDPALDMIEPPGSVPMPEMVEAMNQRFKDVFGRAPTEEEVDKYAET